MLGIQNGKLCEDNGTTYQLIDQVERIAYGAKNKYYYLKRNGSIMLSNFDERKLDMLELTDQMCEFLEKKYPEMQDAIDRRRAYARFNILRQVINSNHKEIEENTLNWIFAHKKQILHNPKSTKRDKLAILSLMINKNFFNLLWKFYIKLKY